MGEKIERVIALTHGVDDEDAGLILALSRKKGLLERKSGDNDNWVEANGGLPKYIEEVANSLHTKRGMPISQAIAVAVSRIKKWAVTGEPDTKAKAAKALSEWSAMKARANAKKKD